MGVGLLKLGVILSKLKLIIRHRPISKFNSYEKVDYIENKRGFINLILSKRISILFLGNDCSDKIAGVANN